MHPNEPIIRYQSYLLRLWQDDPRVIWRASTQCIQTYEITHFATLDALFSFLAAQTEIPANDPNPKENQDRNKGENE